MKTGVRDPFIGDEPGPMPGDGEGRP